jgi:hypothetical protein
MTKYKGEYGEQYYRYMEERQYRVTVEIDDDPD